MASGASATRRPPLRWLLLAAAGVVAVFALGRWRTRPALDDGHVPRVSRATYRDGAYSGWGQGPHGRILATVELRNGRIVSATITRCRTRYTCSILAPLLTRVVERQSADVDVITGASDSSLAFSRAVAAALAEARR